MVTRRPGRRLILRGPGRRLVPRGPGRRLVPRGPGRRLVARGPRWQLALVRLLALVRGLARILWRRLAHGVLSNAARTAARSASV